MLLVLTLGLAYVVRTCRRARPGGYALAIVLLRARPDGQADARDAAVRAAAPRRLAAAAGGDRPPAAAWRALIVEKLPLLALVVLSSVVTFLAQQRGGAVAELNRAGHARMPNAVVSHVGYVAKTAWPADLT